MMGNIGRLCINLKPCKFRRTPHRYEKVGKHFLNFQFLSLKFTSNLA